MQRRTTNQDWINAGYEAVAEGGLNAVRIERIAEKLGVSKAGFYHRFAHRDELVDAILEHWIAEGTVRFDRVAHITDPEQRLRRVGYSMLADRTYRRADAWLLLGSNRDPGLAERSARVRGEAIAWCFGVFQDLGFPERTARARSHLVYTGYLGLIADIEAQQPPPDDSEIRELADQLIDLVTTRPADS